MSETKNQTPEMNEDFFKKLYEANEFDYDNTKFNQYVACRLIEKNGNLLVDLKEEEELKEFRKMEITIDETKKMKAINIYAEAMNDLGWMYQNGYGVKQNYETARKLYEKAAELDYPAAMYNLGRMYQNGYGVKQNYLEALNYYKASLDNDNEDTKKYNDITDKLDKIYKICVEEQKDKEQKDEENEEINKKNSEILTLLGDCYAHHNREEGDEETARYQKAKECYEEAIKLNPNNAKALYELGVIYDNGLGVAEDYNKAAEYYQKAADLGNSNAMNSLGIIYQDGKGVEQDYNKAVEYYAKAITFGNGKARNDLHNLLFRESVKQFNDKEIDKLTKKFIQYNKILHTFHIGNYNNTIVGRINDLFRFYNSLDDMKKGQINFQPENCCLELVKVGNIGALRILGNLYEDGKCGVKQDYEKALNYYRQYVELRNDNEFSEKLFELGEIFEGSGNLEKAIECYEICNKYDNALIKLCNLYVKGKDFIKALECYEKISMDSEQYKVAKDNLDLIYNGLKESNDPSILIKLGEICEKGEDYNKAIEYYKMASELNNSAAMVKLGDLYSKDDWIKKDYNKAIEYYEKAAEYECDLSYVHYRLYHLYDKSKETDKYKENDVIKLFLLVCGVDNLTIDSENDLMEFINNECKYKDQKELIKIYEEASEMGYSSFSIKLGNLYMSGNGVEKNYKKAMEYYKKANYYCNDKDIYNGLCNNLYSLYNISRFSNENDNGDPEFLNMLGDAFLKNSDRLDTAYEKAIYFYEKASELGNSYASYKLADLYQTGAGGNREQDCMKAIEYYKKAINDDKNNVGAINDLDKLYNNLPYFQNKNKENLKKEDVYILYILANSFKANRQYEKASEYFDLASKITSEKDTADGNTFVTTQNIQNDIIFSKKMLSLSKEVEEIRKISKNLKEQSQNTKTKQGSGATLTQNNPVDLLIENKQKKLKRVKEVIEKCDQYKNKFKTKLGVRYMIENVKNSDFSISNYTVTANKIEKFTNSEIDGIFENDEYIKCTAPNGGFGGGILLEDGIQINFFQGGVICNTMEKLGLIQPQTEPKYNFKLKDGITLLKKEKLKIIEMCKHNISNAFTYICNFIEIKEDLKRQLSKALFMAVEDKKYSNNKDKYLNEIEQKTNKEFRDNIAEIIKDEKSIYEGIYGAGSYDNRSYEKELSVRRAITKLLKNISEGKENIDSFLFNAIGNGGIGDREISILTNHITRFHQKDVEKALFELGNENSKSIM